MFFLTPAGALRLIPGMGVPPHVEALLGAIVDLW